MCCINHRRQKYIGTLSFVVFLLFSLSLSLSLSPQSTHHQQNYSRSITCQGHIIRSGSWSRSMSIMANPVVGQMLARSIGNWYSQVIYFLLYEVRNKRLWECRSKVKGHWEKGRLKVVFEHICQLSSHFLFSAMTDCLTGRNCEVKKGWGMLERSRLQEGQSSGHVLCLVHVFQMWESRIKRDEKIGRM